MTYKKLIQEASKMLMSIGVAEARLIPSKNPAYGEITSLAAFEISKEKKVNPQEVALEIVERLKNFKGILVDSVEAVSGYINFKVNWIEYSNLILETVLKEKSEYGKSKIGVGKKIIVEHTSVNPNKALHVGHARNVCIGDTLARLFHFLGYDVIVLNYIDDSGTQMADLLLGFTELGYPMTLREGERADVYYGDVVYVEVSRKIDEDIELAEKRKKIARLIEERDEEYYKLNREIVERVLRDQLKTCWRIGARYNILNMESDILSYDLWGEVFKKLLEKKAVYKAESGSKAGCWLLNLSLHPVLSKEGDEVLVKSDGSTTYTARDIAYGAWKLGGTSKDFRYKIWIRDPWDGEVLITDIEGDVIKPIGDVEKVINVIDIRQKRPQEIVRYALEVLGLPSEKYIHFGYEVVAMSIKDAVKMGYAPEPGQEFVHMSGRRGLYVKVDTLLDMLKERVAREIREKHHGWSSERVEDVAEKIAVGALRYSLLKPDVDKMIILDTDEILRLEGDTGPYLQYSYVRACKILEKSDVEPLTRPPVELAEEEKQLLRRISYFSEIVEEVGRSLLLKTLVNYAYYLASDFNKFYEKITVLHVEEELKRFRLAEVRAFKITFENILNILGIPLVEEM
ncbi:MAG: arginine--tRNA ligase [Aigarchaeota archaeon]|nr:arginine--tRNA ligase [Aigarchaeota archaeon]MCX8193106.1 arginine--tRNA ligase [Nitrososphaeria archaeon]MDW7986729.1 arginine--tRNA ligase [Nitrososphaerota archaeon]